MQQRLPGFSATQTQASAGISQSQVDSVTKQDGKAQGLQALRKRALRKEET